MFVYIASDMKIVPERHESSCATSQSSQFILHSRHYIGTTDNASKYSAVSQVGC